MRKNRSIRNRGKRGKKGPMELDITSLLDILVILLVFLIKSYDSSGYIMNVPNGITLPSSESNLQSQSGLVVQVSKEKIWVDDKLVLDLVNFNGLVYGKQDRKLNIPLYNELMRKKKVAMNLKKAIPKAERFSGVVNLIMEKSLKYREIKRIMYTCAEAGFKTYKFVVLGEDL